jgi:hypothetical protein
MIFFNPMFYWLDFQFYANAVSRTPGELFAPDFTSLNAVGSKFSSLSSSLSSLLPIAL